MSSLGTLIAGTRVQLAFFMEHRDFTKMQLKEVTAWSTIELSTEPRAGRSVGRGLGSFRELVAPMHQKIGYLVDDDPELMARMMIAAQQVRLAMWMDRGCLKKIRTVLPMPPFDTCFGAIVSPSIWHRRSDAAGLGDTHHERFVSPARQSPL